MKNVLNILITTVFILGFTQIKAQEQPLKKREVVKIQTNSICEDCKKRLEGILNYEKGIMYAELDLDTKEIEVKYNTKKTSVEKIRQKISEIGYDADDIKADEKAQSELPKCCRPGGEMMH